MSDSEIDSEKGDDSPEVLSSGESLDSDEIPEPGLLPDLGSEGIISSCRCLKPDSLHSIQTVFKKLQGFDINFSSVPCLTSTIERCFNFVIDFEAGELTWARIFLADNFYRVRHEVLAIIFARIMGIDSVSTDIPFKNFGIDSDRTPDFIVEKDGVYYVFEVTVGMSEEKAYIMKGVEEAGFESKYQKEIEMMQRMKMNVVYKVCYFNMKLPEESSVYEVITNLEDQFQVDLTLYQMLKVMTKFFSRLTFQTKDYLSPAASILFSKEFAVESKHPDLEFLYEKEDFEVNYTYKDFCISVPVYQKINSMWFRLCSIKDRYPIEGGVFSPVLDISNNRIFFMEDSKGITEREFEKIISHSQKQKFFELLKLKIGDRYEKASTAEGGVRYTKRVKKEVKDKRIMEPLDIISDHHPIEISEEEIVDVKFYLNKIDQHTQLKYKPTYYDENYESLYLRSITTFDEENTVDQNPESFALPEEAPETLASCTTEDIDMKRITKELMEKLVTVNSFESSIPAKMRKMKSSFILPVAALSYKDRTNLSYKNHPMIESLYSQNIGDYTKAILSKVLSEDYKFHDKSPAPNSFLAEQYQKRFELSNQATKIVKNFMKMNKNLRFDRNKLESSEKSSFNETTKKISDINSLIASEEKKLGIKKSIGLVRINCAPKTLMNLSFRSEMKHFKDKKVQSTYEGVGYSGEMNMLEILKSEFENLRDTMTLDCGENDDFLIDFETHGDSKMLDQLKKFTINESKNFINQVKNSFLGHSAAFVSRVAHSLTFYSQMPFNNSFVRVDNLGYKNCLIMVRGGSKIFKTKSSKLFRLFFPCNKTVLSQYVDNTYGESSFKHIVINDEDYILTPWSMLHENILMDAISFYPRVCTFCVLNSNHSETFSSQITKYFVNIVLAFHNRRQTESMLANLRYILLSTMGDYSAFSNILPEFIGFNYDKFQAYLRLSIISNYENYYLSLKKIQSKENVNPNSISQGKLNNIITGEKLKDIDELALMIYSTFLMTKAPYQRPVERANNLKGILSIQELYDNEVGLGKVGKDQLDKISVRNEGNFLEYSKNLMKGDFRLDPYYCTQLGIFADSYFSNNVGKDVILVEWLKIINKNWDSMATTTGLRGDKPDTFWGQKGFFVIYDKILNDMRYKEEIVKIFQSDLMSDEKRKAIRKLNLTYCDSMKNPPESLVFHAVDKRQWRGGREIYVMDIDTKRMQQPIEKFMAYLCKKTDTELISIPSDKRSQVIHHALFEKDIPDRDIKTWFLTFDCSKWAPKSMFVKFALMILPMSSIPQTFKVHFLNYLNLLYKKRLYFNTPEVEVLKNNPEHSEIVDKYLVSESKVKGFYMVQPYSWVMGIFNYTSSLMHAFNQKYCSYILKESTLNSFNEECSLFMFAHSDDSGGRLSVSCKPMLKRALFIYEINLKSCNHILSRKKCVVSRIYFEILSIIYMFSQLLALLPKFLGGVRFLPTDKGPAHDMLQSYSKCIELMVAGADFNSAYLYFKFYSAEIWRFYYNRRPIKEDYNRPPQYLGMPDAHPLMILLTGADSDIIRIIFTQGYDKILTLIKLYKYFDLFETDEGMIKPLKFQVKVRGIKNKFEDSLSLFKEEISKWSIANVNYGNTVMNSLSFLRKLVDPGFVGALANETEVRRMSRAYYFRSGESVITKFGNKKLSEVMDFISEVSLLQNESDKPLFRQFFGSEALEEFKEEISPSNPMNKYIITYFKDIYANPLKLNEHLNRLDFRPEKMRKMVRTLKPTHLQIVKFGRGFNTQFDPTQLVSMVYEPDFSWCLPNPNNLISAKEDFKTLMNHLALDITKIDAGTALKIVRAHQSKSVKEMYMYSCIPGHIRLIKNFSGMLTFLATNSFHDREIQGMTLKLRSNLTQGPITEMDIDEEAYYIATMLDVLLTIGKHVSLVNLDFYPISNIGYEGGSIEELIELLTERKFSDINYTYYQHYIEYIRTKHILWYGHLRGMIFEKGSYYTFLKEQKFKGVWYGKGTIAFYSQGDWVVFEIFNSKVTSCIGNIKGKIDRRLSAFLNDTFIKNNINPAFSEELMKSYELRSHTFLGFDLAGDLTVDTHINMRSGVPYEYRGAEHSFIGDIHHSDIEHIKENMFVAKIPGKLDLKIYTLKVDRGEVIPIIKSLINPESLEAFLKNNAYNDFAEFISQSILVDYGAEYYTTLEKMKNNYTGSMLYQLMTDTQTTSPHLIPRKIKCAVLPAPEGSLLRMLIQYQEDKNQEILKMPKNLNPSILSIRNEYPESFSVILSEKMSESFNSIYDKPEQLQLTSEFLHAANQNDLSKVRSSMLKLMCYWGYSSLVNVIQTYTFNQSNKNHQIFNLESCRSNNLGVYSNLFSVLINKTIESAIKVFDSSKNYDFPIKGVFNYNDINKLKNDYFSETVYNCYNYTIPFINPSLSGLKMNNLLIGLFKDQEFVFELINSLKKVFPLNTLSFEPKYINDVISTYNTLKLIFIESHKPNEPYNLNYKKPYEHLPHHLTQPLSIMREIGLDNHPPARLKHHFFLNDNLRHELNREEISFHAGGVRYVIQQEICDLTDVEVPTSDSFKFEGVLTEDYLESDEFSDISYEFITDSPDMELVMDSLKPYKEMYEPTVIKKRGKSMIVPIKWVILPNVEGRSTLTKFINNIGENVVILSNCILRNFEELRNSYVYIVNYSRYEGELSDMVAHVMSSKHLERHFWDKFIGGRRVDNHQYYSDLCKSNLIRVKGEVKGADQFGKFIAGSMESSEEVKEVKTGDPLRAWVDIGVSKKDAEVQLAERQEIRTIISDIETNINEYVARGAITKERAEKIFNKYKEAALSKITSKRNIILNSFFTEIELLNINEGVKSGEISNEMTPLEHIKMMQAPESFGAAFSRTKPDAKSFKDIRYKAELESLHHEMSDLVASSSLTISNSMFKIVKAYYNSWRFATEGTKYKREMKQFFLNLFLSILNGASCHEKSDHDRVWQGFCNNIALIIGEEPMEEEEKSLYYRLPPSGGLRMKYEIVGME